MKLSVDRITKQYKNKIAVDRISFELTEGVTGLLGANGAGKTTLMRMMSGILTPTGGEITADGIPVNTENYRALLGYLPQDFGYYPEFSAREFLEYMGALKGIARKKIKTYSGGMKQRVGIAQALLNDPAILILDEPTAGLDPKERVRFRTLIEELGKKSIVLLSTHIVSDIEHIADRIIMMKDGNLIWQGNRGDVSGDLEEFYLKKYE